MSLGLARRLLSPAPWSRRLVTGHASTSRRARRERKGKRPEQWTPEEVAEKLSFLEEQVDQGLNPNPRHLAAILQPIRHHRNPDDLSRVLHVVQRSQLPVSESLGSALVSGLAKGGRVDDVKMVVQQMQGRLRMNSQSSVLTMACQMKDDQMALEYLTSWDTAQHLPDGLVRLLIALSRESEATEIMERLLETIHETGQPLGADSAAELRMWGESQPQPFTSQEAIITSSGFCTNCKSQLGKALTEADHQQLLEAVTDAVHSEGLGFSPELISNLSRLKQQLAANSTPYRVIVDGLNVSRIASKHFNVMHVMDIVNQLTESLGGPVLVVARKHLAREMDQLLCVTDSADFTVFTTRINEISDDICVIYAALITGRDCYVVSNDHMSDNSSMLSPRHARLFTMWQASRQITVHPTKVCPLYPTDHSHRAQRSQSGWHIPFIKTTPHPSKATSTNQDTWILEGRERWDHRDSPQGQPSWLCLRQTV